MKNLCIGLFILLIAMPVFAKIKAKHVAGTWTYTVQAPDGDLTGSLEFTKEKKGKLSGKVITDTGDTFTMLKVEIKEGDVVYFEIQPDYEVMKVTMTLEDDKYKGIVAVSQGELPVMGEKRK
jgi:hypothetical protein